MRNEFSTFDIVKALKIPRERLREWMNRLYIRPTMPPQGQGKKAVFSRQDVYDVQLFRQLVDFGIERDTAQHHVKFYHDRMKTDHNNLSYMIILYGKMPTPMEYESKIQYSSFFAQDGETLNLDFGSTSNNKRLNDKYWRDIHIVNLKILHKETDSALESL